MTSDLESQPWLLPQDPLGERMAQLRALFPEAFPEGVLDLDRLHLALGATTPTSEAFGLSWPGKPEAVRAASTPASGTLRPDRAASIAFESAPHVMIEGDNLEVLKLLQRSYHGAVKLIFIDPPYNTGKTFIYADDYRDGVRDYLKASGQAGLVTNPEAGGRFHSRWLSMMLPRLTLARQLLKDDGFLVVAIDDHEVHHLRLVLDELFGAEQFIAHVVWQKKYTRSNDARFFSDTHDHLLVYARRRDAAHLNLLPRDEAQTKAYANPDADPRGPWKATPLHAKSGRTQGFSYTFKNGATWSPPPGTFPRFSKDTLAALDAAGELWFGADGKAVPARKTYLQTVKPGVTPVTIWPYQEVGHTHEANQELKALLGECLFDNPKPTRLIRRFLELMTSPDGEDVVLDFFAGSGTTGHAVLLQNEEDGGNRKFILVQLPEPTGRPDYPTIPHITRARLSKASRGAGFKAFTLDSSNFTPWEPTTDLAVQLQHHDSSVLPDRNDEDLLFELMLKFGLPLTTPVVQPLPHTYQAGSLVLCLTTPDLPALLALSPDPLILKDTTLTDTLKANLLLHHPHLHLLTV